MQNEREKCYSGKKYLKSGKQNCKLDPINIKFYNVGLGKTMPRPGIIQNSCKRALRIWTMDLQIFSLTLSELSYLGSDASMENNVK